jgi:hypothetical protein
MILLQAFIDSLANLITLVAIPLLAYFCLNQIRNWRVRRKPSSQSKQQIVGLRQMVERLVHASGNVAMALIVATNSVGS